MGRHGPLTRTEREQLAPRSLRELTDEQQAQLRAMPRRTLTDRMRYWQERHRMEGWVEPGAPGRHRRSTPATSG